MERIFVIATPNCPYHQGRKVGSKECMQCDSFRGGIVENFVDCDHGSLGVAKSEMKSDKIAKKRGRPAKKAVKKPVKTRKAKKQ